LKNIIIKRIEIPKLKEEAATAIIEQIKNLIDVAEPEDLVKLQKSLEPKVVSPHERKLAKKILGKNYVEPNPSKLLELQLANLQRYYQRRCELLAQSITSSKAAELLGCENRSTVRDRRIAKKILGLKDKGVYKYPLWQFDPEGDDGLIDGLAEVLAALDVSDFTKLNWLCKPHLAFEQKTPVEMLKKGEIKAVVIEARAVGVAQ
jgi:hypothetical protein